MDLLVSMAYKGAVGAVFIMQGGRELYRCTERISGDGSVYKSAIQMFHIALVNVRKIIQEDAQDYRVCFETGNGLLAKWVDEMYAGEEYEEEFDNVLKLLQSLPIKYMFSHNRKPKALLYVDESYIVRPKLEGLEVN